MNNIIFLDIDGVLNSGQYITKLNGAFDLPINQIDPEAVKRLNIITNTTNAKIVVSSTWRLFFLNKCSDPLRSLQGCLSMYNITGDIIDLTPYNPYVKENQRGFEIQDYINQNYKNINKFIILDDDSDIGDDLFQYHIKTDFEYGLQDAHVEKCILLLGKV